MRTVVGGGEGDSELKKRKQRLGRQANECSAHLSSYPVSVGNSAYFLISIRSILNFGAYFRNIWHDTHFDAYFLSIFFVR